MFLLRKKKDISIYWMKKGALSVAMGDSNDDHRLMVYLLWQDQVHLYGDVFSKCIKD